MSYYQQLASGQLRLLATREPIERIVDDPQRDPALRARLANALQARAFASDVLHLPDNRSYRLYADIGRRYVVWNVFATDEFSLDPVTHCFPIAGCVAYRGYYSPGGARGEAAVQKLAGNDVYVSGVEAYSTLGWFDDPILSSMMGWGDERLATLIFHELAHQRFYVKDDTAFNESYANFVEQEGTRQWRRSRGLAAQKNVVTERRDQFTALILDTREQLRQLYAQPLSPEVMRQRKQQAFETMRQRYRQLRDGQWNGDNRFDAWIDAPMNNARLLPFGLYDHWVPAFAALFREVGGDWPRFFEAVEALGGQPVRQRHDRLESLMPPSS